MMICSDFRFCTQLYTNLSKVSLKKTEVSQDQEVHNLQSLIKSRMSHFDVTVTLVNRGLNILNTRQVGVLLVVWRCVGVIWCICDKITFILTKTFLYLLPRVQVVCSSQVLTEAVQPLMFHLTAVHCLQSYLLIRNTMVEQVEVVCLDGEAVSWRK